MKKLDYQVVTSENEWVGGGENSTQKEIDDDLNGIKERLLEEGFEGEIIVFKAEKLTKQSIKVSK